MNTSMITVRPATGRSFQQRVLRWSGQLVIHAILLVGVIFTCLPIFYMVSSSFKSEVEIFAVPIHWFPDDFQGFDNYRKAFQVAPFGQFFLNSVIMSVTRVAGVLFFSALAGYGLAKYAFPGNRLCFLLILSTMMVPFQVLLLPLYVLTYQFGWVNTYMGLIIPGMVSAFGVFLMRQFCLTIPDELLDAGRIDGASEFRIFLSVVMPLLMPPLATLAILTFMWSWNSLFWPMIVATRPNVMTLTVGMTFFQQPLREPYWTYIMAVSTVATLPIILLFLSLQRYFVQGVVLSGVK
ncbi:MAG: carbohydrate ABC transporter permease [Caldilineaceae bacterium]|nr:carbohydrate ABC transporter permease [Caldilineaceae bacterium]